MSEGPTRRLAAVLAADMVGYSRLMAQDEAGTLAALKACRRELIDPTLARYSGTIVKTTGDGLLVEFPSAAAAVSAALLVQAGMGERNVRVPAERRVEFRIGITIGDITVDRGDIFGDGVNIAARLQASAEPNGIVISEAVSDSVAGKLNLACDDLGPLALKNIARPVRALRVSVERSLPLSAAPSALIDIDAPVPGFAGRPAIAVLAFDNLSGQRDDEYLADGIAEDILTRLCMWRWIPVIARNSSFTYKGKATDIKQIGRELGARFVLEGSVRRAGERVRVTGQLIDALTGHHLWAERYDRRLADIFDLQDEITGTVVAALEPAIGKAEMQRARMRVAQSGCVGNHSSRPLALLSLYARRSDRRLPPISQGERAGLLVRAATRIARRRLVPRRRDRMGGAEIASRSWCCSKVRTRMRRHGTAGQHHGRIGQHRGSRVRCGLPTLSTRRRIKSELCLRALRSWLRSHHDGAPRDGVAAINTALQLSPQDAMMAVWLSTLSWAHYNACDYEPALLIAAEAARLNPDYPLAQRGRALALARLGRVEEARAAFDRFMSLVPSYSLANASVVPFRRDSDREHFLAGLRLAGWKE